MKNNYNFSDGIHVGIIIGIFMGFFLWLLYTSQIGYVYTKSYNKIPPYELMDKVIKNDTDTIYVYKIYLE